MKAGVSHLRILGLLADPTRLRLMAVLRGHELSVAELQEALNLGQSRISTHLGQLKEAGLVATRRDGQKTYYRREEDIDVSIHPLLEAALQAAAELDQAAGDLKGLEMVLRNRREATQAYFNTLAGRLSRNYCPGRSWQAMGQLLLHLTPELVIADLGAGEGMISQLLAPRAKKVIAVDLSPKMVEVGRRLARENGLERLEFREGDMETPPIKAGTVDIAILSQALHHAESPPRALAAARAILKPGGRLLILDLKEHHFEKAREMFGDRWLGFSEREMFRMLEGAGFKQPQVSVVARESEPPHFETLLAAARR